MPNSLTAAGLTTATYDELQAQYETNFETAYGDDINLASNTPDGQIIGNFVQSNLDVEDLISSVNTMFDPDQAVGVILDQRCAINGIRRQGGTYTVTPITVVTSRTLTLYGLDQTAQPVYTVADSQGNQWQLQTTQTSFVAGTNAFNFQSATPGANSTVVNTITTQVTIVIGVVSVNNPTTFTTIGITEEQDSALKIRRQQSTAISNQSFYDGLLAALKNINGVSSAFVYENDGSTTDANSVPGHSIWVIVAGSGAAASIAQAIYSKRNSGCGMKGSVSFVITRSDGTPFTVFWDDVQEETLFIAAYLTSLNGVNPPNIAAIQAGLVTSFSPGVAAEVNVNALSTAIQAIDPNSLVTFSGAGTPSPAGFSTTSGGAYSLTLTPTAKNLQFSIEAENIILLPMQLNPVTSTVTHAATQQFSSLGGYGTLTYSISVNNSGGSINSSSGLYTAGATHPRTDTVLVTDSLGNTATATVSVT